MSKIINQKFILYFILLGFLGCATQLSHLKQVRACTAKNQFQQAAEVIKQNNARYGERDRVLYHLDRGILFLYAGDFDQAIEYLTIAEKEMLELFTKSISKEAASLVTNEYVLPYVGLDYEQILVNAFLALAYAGKRNYNDALVEVRKADTKFKLLKEKHAKSEKGI
ncbi:MAG: hypothetical protein AB1633_13700, partial [Elusimicrobiota bacterium]